MLNPTNVPSRVFTPLALNFIAYRQNQNESVEMCILANFWAVGFIIGDLRFFRVVSLF
jgi:hypothetical protein